MRRAVWLIDSGTPLLQAVELWARRVESEPPLVFSTPSEGLVPGDVLVGVCIVRIRGDSGAYERVARIMRKVAPTPVVVLAENLRVDTAVSLMRLGAADVIELPATPADVVARALAFYQEMPSGDTAAAIVGQSPAMTEVRRHIGAAARVESTVLIQGETGTGKGLVARALHAQSSRKDRPFVHVDCAALTPSLIESEFFGHEKGSFTGASALRRGRFERAGRGTIFLDEIGDLDFSLQSRLLRVLQDRTFERVGGTETLRMEARVIAATSSPLLKNVQERRFRPDLYFRLKVFSMQVPPLRERRADIPLLVRFGIDEVSRRVGVRPPAVSDGFYERLYAHTWPGNVRELLNVLERCLVELRVDTLEAQDLEGMLDGERSVDAYELAADGDEFEHDETAIRLALIESGGNVSRTARRLRIQRGKLRYRIQKYGLEDLIPDD